MGLIWTLSFFISLFTTQGCATMTDRCNGQCCENFYRKGETCVHNCQVLHQECSHLLACENGTFGLKCELRCPKYHYGQFCEQMCSCNTTDCDPVYGICYSTWRDTFSGNCKNSIPTWILEISGVAVALLLLILTAFAFCIICRKRNSRRRKQSNLLNSNNINDKSTESASLQDDMNIKVTGMTIRLETEAAPRVARNIVPVGASSEYQEIDTLQSISQDKASYMYTDLKHV